jgi:hypothetical protein
MPAWVGIDSIKDLLMALGPLLTVSVLIFTLLMTRVQKRTDIAMECHRRFDQLLQLQHELDAKLSNKRRKDPKYSLTDEDRQAAYDYYARFFSLQPRRLPLARRLSAYAQIAAPARQAAMLLRHRTAR